MTLLDDLITTTNNALDVLEAALENLGGNMATQEEIKAAIVQALEESASRFLSGQAGNVLGGIEIDKDGHVVIKPPSGVPDDPATTADNEARTGGVISIRKGFNLIWTDLNTYYTANPQVPVATAQLRIKSKYKVADEGAMDAAVALYYTNRQVPIAQVSSFADTLDSRLYCNGQSKQTINAWIFDTVATASQEQAIALVKAVSDSQIDEWYRKGAVAGSKDYVSYSCVPVVTEEFTLDGAFIATGNYKIGVAVHKLNHRIQIEVSGKVNHPSDGSYQDFFYHVAANGTKSFATIATSWGSIQFNSAFGNPPQTKVQFEPSGVYRLTMDTSGAAVMNFRRIVSLANQAAGTTGFTVKFTDLGEFI